MEQKEETVEEWKQHWVEGNAPWHKAATHEFLLEYYGQCSDGGRCLDVLVPLCGKSVDMKWLVDQGNRVCGVEASELAAKAFFDEQGIKYTGTPSGDFILLESEDKKIRIFCGDFYKFSREQAGRQFDFIWDRGSFVAINLPDRTRYVNLVQTLLLPTGRILLSTLNYDPSKWPGPPHYVTPEDIQNFFGSRFHINHLCTKDRFNESYKEKFNVDWINESCHMLSVKT